MAVKLQIRRGLSSEWTTHNPILMEGELGLELDTDKWKIGNGVDAWDIRPYAPQGMAGEKGDTGDTGDTAEISSQNIVDALGYIPEDENNVGKLSELFTDNQLNIVSAINEVKSQSNENAEQIANRVKKDGDDITGVISLDRVSYYNLCNTINIRGVNKFLISTRIRAISAGNPVTLHLLSTGIDLNILDIILKFDTTLGPTVKYVGAHSRNAHVPELKVGIDADGYFLIGVNSNSLSYGNISITALARNKNTLGAVSERFQITPDVDLPLTAVSITSIPYTSKGSAIV